MASRFQAAILVSSPMCSNAIAWSDENLIAAASGHCVTIMNPAMPFGPKGLITIPDIKPFPVGVIESKDLDSGCMFPTCLSREARPCVRSISWSPLGFAPNAGCLLAVCTTKGVVKVYRSPFCEFSADWVEVMDISEMLHTYFAKMRYGEAHVASPEDSSQVNFEQGNRDDGPIAHLRIRSKGKRQNNPPLITAEQYARRSAMLSSLVAVWSPMLDSESARRFCVLAIGAKSGIISFWRVHEPQCYSITQGSNPAPVASFIGFIQAHNSWITAISFSKFVSDGSPQLLLSTGSSDGSVKLWRVYISDLLKSTEESHASFSLLKEVISIGSGACTVLSLLVPDSSPHKIILAVGRGSGSLELLTYDTSVGTFDVSGSHYAHNQAVTGLAWAFDGQCLYSCSQDNSLHSWIIKGYSLHEVPLPSNIVGVKMSTDVPSVSDACFGIAVSPANLVLAVVRRFDVNALNPMYQKSSLKAVVEFFWIGGQKLQDDGASDDESLVCWGRNILWSLNHYVHHLDKPLVVWDMIAALSAFIKKSQVSYVEQILVKWLTSSLGFECVPSLESVFPHVYRLSSRQLHLLNVINRHVILREAKLDDGEHTFARKESKVWITLLEMCEKHIRERLVGCSFSAILNGNLPHTGLAQMRLWVAKNDDMVQDYVKRLASEVKKIKKRYVAEAEEERCSYCLAGVPFEDTDVAYCRSVDRHKMARCAVSMVVCSLSPLWFCVSCMRRVSNLAPETLFTLLRYPAPSVDQKGEIILSKPLCPFCGILLQRLQPKFLLSTLPV
ncbi:putative transcription factor WD40-like family [Helianthus annuus]|nr:putative transcription factor WD40-like family [Helianthus annuus]